MVEIKFCGLTRPDDARLAGELGASYIGVIFAGGPRHQTPDAARRVLDGCTTEAKRVGVMARSSVDEMARLVDTAALDVVQLHGEPTPAEVEDVRRATGAEVWAVIRVADALPVGAEALFASADAVVLDAKVDGMLGGTGIALPWQRIAAEVDTVRRGGRLVLAGGLRPENLATATSILSPDVVDVSSGVESAPGIKDHARMRAFAAAAATHSEKR